MAIYELRQRAPYRAVAYKLHRPDKDGQLFSQTMNSAVPLTATPPRYIPPGRYAVSFYDARGNRLPLSEDCWLDIGDAAAREPSQAPTEPARSAEADAGQTDEAEDDSADTAGSPSTTLDASLASVIAADTARLTLALDALNSTAQPSR